MRAKKSVESNIGTATNTSLNAMIGLQRSGSHSSFSRTAKKAQPPILRWSCPRLTRYIDSISSGTSCEVLNVALKLTCRSHDSSAPLGSVPRGLTVQFQYWPAVCIFESCLDFGLCQRALCHIMNGELARKSRTWSETDLQGTEQAVRNGPQVPPLLQTVAGVTIT